ncbi:terpene cyclase/mutase family protein [soil metagenome]
MMRWPLLPAAALLGFALIARGEAGPAKAPAWDATAASRYLDGRLAWWRQWPKAERDHGTHCVSCHTSLPHTLAMPSLRGQMGTARHSVDEMAMFDDVVKRVYLWDEVEPFYPDQTRGVPKSAESRGVESVLNALILATRDQERGHLGPDTRQAFANMWAVQMQAGEQKGGFTWLNFRLEPFESATATYWGATLAALAVARAPDGYAADPAIAPQLDALRGFLRTGLNGQSLYIRTLLLWADSQLHGVLDPSQRQKIVGELTAAQGADGGWSLPSLSNWQRIDKSVLPPESDGYATAVVALVLREAGMAPAPLGNARNWLAAHQDRKTGAVTAKSINNDRQPGTDAYLFMTDEATGMAALALRTG